MPRAFIKRRIMFWITSEDLFSNQPSAIHASEAITKVAKPTTVIRAFALAATIAAPRTVVQVAKVLRAESSSMFCSSHGAVTTSEPHSQKQAFDRNRSLLRACGL